jgi:hypothetical protein
VEGTVPLPILTFRLPFDSPERSCRTHRSLVIARRSPGGEEHRISQGEGEKSRKLHGIESAEHTTCLSSTWTTRPRGQQLNATSGQPQGEAYVPPSSRENSRANIGQVQAGTTRNQQQQQIISGECARVLPLYHSMLMPSRDRWAIRAADGITTDPGTSRGSNLGAYKPHLH